MISITAELLTGTVRANADDAVAGTGDRNVAEWPPSPARLFQALVAGGGSDEYNRISTDDGELRLLESATPPLIAASASEDVLTSSIQDRFVVLDDRAKNRVHEYAARVSGLIRPGDRTSPKSKYVTYLWPELEADESTLQALRMRAARVSYLGCADSPVRLMVNEETPREDRQVWKPSDTGEASVSVPYVGYLGALDRNFQAFRNGASPRAAKVRRVQVRYRSPESASVAVPSPHLIWLQFDSPFNGRRAMRVGEALRNAVLAKYDDLGLGEPPAVLHGHGLERGTQQARYIPLPDVGYRYSTGRLMGAAIWLPANTPRIVRGNVEVAAADVRDLYLEGGQSHSRVQMRDPSVSAPWTTNPRRWLQPSTRFQSALPVVHERFGKVTAGNTLDIAGQWCRNAGLPAPVEARVGRVPFAKGPARFTAHDVWREGSTKGYPFSHVSLTFGVSVTGPIAIGRGRTFGLGLLAPVIKNSDGARV